MYTTLELDSLVLFSLYFFFFSLVFFFLNRFNPFLILIVLELQLIVVCFLFIYFSVLNFSILGFVFALYIVAFAGAEASVGISILIVFYRLRGVLSLDFPVANL